MTVPPPLRFESDTGVRIYRISSEAFPGLVVHCYLLVGAGPVTLVDTGSGYGDSTPQLLAGLDQVRREYGERAGPAEIERVIITHGHLDHFGGIAQLSGPVTAKVGIHELDRWVLAGYEERIVVATKALLFYLTQAGVPEQDRGALLEMYTFGKQHLRSVPVDFTLEDGQTLDGIEVIHTPGHCPGQVCLKIGDILLSADHVLPRTTPHQNPESITAWTGLGHYLDSLDKIERVPGVRLALGGHETPLAEFYPRIEAIRVDHRRKLDRIADALRGGAGTTIEELRHRMYPGVEGWNILLALTEIGAHVEYLYERGHLRVANLDQVVDEFNPALRYVTV
ncbi:MAG: MBL fold metallo-hydrolase [Gemmatimonadales bacterium]|nr:MBL fold metallo-hydrolase [Gemmatimonadales bacterium]